MKRSGFKGLVAAGIVAAGLASSTSVVSASDIFLKIGDIKGESVDDKHKDWIEVLSWSWGTSTGTGKTKRGTVAPQCIQDPYAMTDGATAHRGARLLEQCGIKLLSRLVLGSLGAQAERSFGIRSFARMTLLTFRER